MQTFPKSVPLEELFNTSKYERETVFFEREVDGEMKRNKRILFRKIIPKVTIEKVIKRVKPKSTFIPLFDKP